MDRLTRIGIDRIGFDAGDAVDGMTLVPSAHAIGASSGKIQAVVARA